MAIQEKQLGQARENSTNAVSVYSPAASTTAIIKTMIVCNTTPNDRSFRIFLDDDGSTYDQSTALFYNIPIGAYQTVQIDGWYPMNDAGGNLAYRSDNALAITITIFGLEIT